MITREILNMLCTNSQVYLQLKNKMCIKSLVKYAMMITECANYNEIYQVSELEVKELALCVAVLEDVEAGFAIEKIREKYFKNN